MIKDTTGQIEQHYKDVAPEDTIFNIYSALYKCGINITYSQNPKSVNGCYSNRVTIEGTSLGSNGKGVNKIYALASGHAELAERLQNNMIYLGAHNPKLYKELGFCYSPDEKFISKNDLVSLDNSFMTLLYSRFKAESYLDRISLINRAVDSPQKALFNDIADNVLCIPFYSIKAKKTEYLPYYLYSKLYGSNGMSAGNTVEEAMVQGLSEIYERYVNRWILENSITPPSIPQEVIENSRMKDVVKEITKSGRYSIDVKDLSLGKGYPVVGTIITDKETGRFGFRLGAHPSFEIALERTLTEAFQGRSIENFVGTAVVGADEEACDQSNIYNIFRNGEGAYRSALFGDNPTYEYKPFSDVSDLSNSVLMDRMLKPLLDNGYDVLVRNSGYLGLPALQIIVPGINEMNEFSDTRLRFENTHYRISEGIGEGKLFDKQLKQRLMRYVKYMLYQNRAADCTWERISSRPISYIAIDSGLDIPLVMAVICYSMNNYADALQLLNSISSSSCDSENYTLIRSVKLYIQQIAQGKTQKEAAELIHKLYKPSIAEKICDWLSDPTTSAEKIFPMPNCWNCEECAYAKDGRCSYQNVYDVFYKLGKAMKDNLPNQSELEKYFNK